MKISLVNVWSDLNKGDSAIVLSTISFLKKLFPNAKFYSHLISIDCNTLKDSQHQEYPFINPLCKQIYPSLMPDIKKKKNRFSPYGRAEKAWKLFRGIVVIVCSFFCGGASKYFLAHGEERQAFDVLASSDLIVSIGGSYLMSYSKGLSNTYRVIQIMFPLIIATLFKRKCIILGASIGPIEGTLSRWIVKVVLNKSRALYVRERFSLEYVSALGIKAPTKVIPDIAFMLTKPYEYEKDHTEADLDIINNNKYKVGVTVRNWVFPGFNSADKVRKQDDYYQKMALFLDYIIRDIGVTVYLIPQATGPTPIEDDRIANLELYNRMAQKESVIIVQKDFSPWRLKDIYKKMDFLIATRLHSIILAIPVPFLAIAYMGKKTYGTLELLGLSNYAVDISDFTLESLKDKFINAWNNREKIRENLQHKEEEFKREYKNLAEEIKDLII